MTRIQLKDFLMNKLKDEKFKDLLWWEDEDEGIFCIKLADGRKNRKDLRCAALTKAWERVKGRLGQSNSKMNFKEALKHCPYVQELAKDTTTGIKTMQFVEKGVKPKMKRANCPTPEAMCQSPESISYMEADSTETSTGRPLPTILEVAKEPLMSIGSVISNVFKNNGSVCENAKVTVLPDGTVTFEFTGSVSTASARMSVKAEPADNPKSCEDIMQSGGVAWDHAYSERANVDEEVDAPDFGDDTLSIYGRSNTDMSISPGKAHLEKPVLGGKEVEEVNRTENFILEQNHLDDILKYAEFEEFPPPWKDILMDEETPVKLVGDEVLVGDIEVLHPNSSI